MARVPRPASLSKWINPRFAATMLCGCFVGRNLSAALRRLQQKIAALAETARLGVRLDVFAYSELPPKLEIRPAMILERPKALVS